MPPKKKAPLRKLKSVVKASARSSKPQLYDVVSSSYGSKKSINKLQSLGYSKDKELSNHNQSVFYNPNEKKAIVAIAGTHNLKDWGTDAYYALTGDIKNTNRYKEALNVYKKTHEKYKPVSTVVGMHSLSGAFGSELPQLGPNDRFITYNKAAHPLTTTVKPHETNVRAFGDVVSVFSKHQPRTITFRHHHLNPLGAHSSSTLKDLNFEV